MSGNADDPLLSVAGKISSGVPVDWNELETQIGTPEEAAVAEELRSLERYARVNESVPASWGRFQVIEQIGVGAFAVVYRALDPTLQSEVALKVTKLRHPELAGEREVALDEARRLVRIKHPNVVRVFGVERVGDEIGLSMELVRGQTLADAVGRQGAFGSKEATLIGIDLCLALASVHGAGILHGDVKAHNVMREQGGRTVLMDFGTGRNLNAQPSVPGSDFAGTALYLAPEVFAGANRSMASEIYSVGVLLYFLVTGSYPVQGETRTAIGQVHELRGTRKPLRDARADLPDGFVRVVERALAEEPAQRFQSAGAMETALVQLLQPAAQHEKEPVAPRPVLKALLAAFALVVLAAASFTVSQLRTPSTSIGQRAEAGASVPPVTAASAASAANIVPEGEYRVDAAFYRERIGSVERLKPGTKVAPDETLSLQIEVSSPAYVYVVNEDETGASYLLFPLPGLALTNPLPSGQRHRLPGMWNGEAISWQVTTAGQKEHFLIVASPQRSPEFEEMFASLPQPSFGRSPARKLTTDEIGVLRSVGGLTTSPTRKDRQLRLLPEFSKPLAPAEELVRGVWIRHATFDNP